MDTFEACMIIEGERDVVKEEFVEAVQYLIDSGVVWRLQGFYGRLAMSLIESGDCYATTEA